MRTFFWALLLTGFCSCQKRAAFADIKAVINTVYRKPDVYHQIGKDTLLFSAPLRQLIRKAGTVEQLDRQRVLQSEYPNDKPLLIEGEIFTGIYEGYTSFEVGDVVIQGKTAKAIVCFKNEGYDLRWRDTLLLTDAHGWKLDDVVYGKGSGSLRKTLSEFIGAYQGWSKIAPTASGSE